MAQSLRNLSPNKIHNYLLLPNLKKTALTPEEKKFVEYVFKVLVNDINIRIHRIERFFEKYNRVYVRYKHIFSAMVGTYAIQQNEKKSRIFLRDRYEDKKTNAAKRSTYVIPATPEALCYYEEVKNDIERVFLYLLESHIQSMQNCGEPFLMPDIYSIPEHDKTRWLQDLFQK